MPVNGCFHSHNITLVIANVQVEAQTSTNKTFWTHRLSKKMADRERKVLVCCCYRFLAWLYNDFSC